MNLKELLAARLLLFTLISGMIDKAKEEKRELTPDELKTWDEKVAEIEEYDKKIERAQKQEELEKRFAQQQFKKEQQSPEAKLNKRFDLFKALREAPSGKFTGAEAEMNQEGVNEFGRSNIAPSPNALILPSSYIKFNKRAYAEVDTTAAAEFIKTDVANELHIVKTPLLLSELGVKIWDDLKGNLKLPNQAQLTATFVAEKAAVDGAGVAPGGDTLAPRRVGGGDSFTKELLNQTSQAVQNDLLNDFGGAIWRAIQKDLFAQIGAAGTILSGHATTDTTAAMTHAFLLAMEAAIETGGDKYNYLMSPGQRAKLKALELGTGIRFAWHDDNTVNGYKAYATSSIVTNGGQSNANFDVIFGDFMAAVIGLWGGIELIVDPYTNAKLGEYVITANALADTAIKNQKSFSVIRNADA